MEFELLTKEVETPVSQERIIIREQDGYAERLLLKKGKRIHQCLPDYLSFMIQSINGEKCTTERVRQFLVPDYEYSLIEAYRVCYGDTLTFVQVCPSCGQLNEHSIDLSQLPLIPLPEEVTGGPDPVVDFVLPRTKKRARVGFLTVASDMIINEQHANAGSADLNQGDFLSLRMLEGSDPLSYEDVVRLPLMDHKIIRQKRRLLQAGYDPLVTLICESCQNYDVTNILGLRDFLFPSG